MKALKITEWILAALELVLGIVFLVSVGRLNMLPMKYFAVAVAFVLIVAAVTAFLTRFKAGGIISIVMSVLFIGVYGYGAYMVNHASDTLDKVTGIEVQENTVAVFVKADSKISSAEDLTGKKIAVNTTFDKEHTDELVENLQKKINSALNLKEYASPVETVDALLSGDVDAFVLSESYISILTDLEGYEDIESRIKIVYEYRYTNKVVIDEPSGGSNENQQGGTGEAGYNTEYTTLDTSNFDPDAFVVYISGSDTRSNVLDVSRSDVNILAFVNPNKREVLLVNTPRDYFVPLPISDGVCDKLTHAGIYGVEVSMGALGMLYGITPKYYAQVNFVGFEKLIDALGGVSVYSEYAFSNYGVNVVEGYNTFNGSQALAFVRERYQLPGGDRQRGKNQMAVIQAVIAKAASPAILTNYTGIMNSMTGTFATNVSTDFISSLVKKQLDEGGTWTVNTYAVDGTGMYSSCYSMPTSSVYVMVPNADTVNAAIERIQAVMNKQ